MLTITLPEWMLHRIVEILEHHEYTGAADIVRAVKDQTTDAE